jgi:hypothetical protein
MQTVAEKFREKRATMRRVAQPKRTLFAAGAFTPRLVVCASFKSHLAIGQGHFGFIRWGFFNLRQR